MNGKAVSRKSNNGQIEYAANPPPPRELRALFKKRQAKMEYKVRG
jgi:hypothetical protein